MDGVLTVVLRGIPMLYTDAFARYGDGWFDHFRFDNLQCEMTDQQAFAKQATDILSMVHPAFELLRVGQKDLLQSDLCLPKGGVTANGDGSPATYILSARIKRVDMGAGDNEIAKSFSVCFDSCNDYVCEVKLVKKEST